MLIEAKPQLQNQRIVEVPSQTVLPACKGLSSFWCFVFVLHCLIYKVQTAHLADLIQYSTFSFLCQALFRGLYAFIQCPTKSFAIVPYLVLLVKTFFKFLELFASALTAELIKLTTLGSVCQVLLEAFFTLSRTFLLSSPQNFLSVPHSIQLVKSFFRSFQPVL